MINSMKKLITISASLFFIGITVFAQDTIWVVPESKKSLLSPFTFNEEFVSQGKEAYYKNCSSCHGDPGKANFQPLAILPPDPASEKMQNNTDGEIFYKISEGKGLMPRFKDILSDDDKWRIIAFMRSFNQSYAQDTIIEVKEESGNTKKLMLQLAYDKTENRLFIKVKENLEGDIVPAKGVEINLFSKRYFGNLSMGESVMSDSLGLAVFIPDTTLPGDTEGNIVVLARVADYERYGDVQRLDTLQIGKITIPENILEPRTIWGVRAKTPLWIIFSYTSVVLGVMGTLAFIAFLVWRIKKLGQKND